MNAIVGLTSQQLRMAADLKEEIVRLSNELSRLLGVSASVPSDGRRIKRKMSAAARAKIAAAQRRRWKEAKSKNKPMLLTQPKKRGWSKAAKARLAARMKAVWAARKANEHQ